MKKLFLLLLFSSLISQTGIAQELPPYSDNEADESEIKATASGTAPKSISKWAFGLTILQWNESLKIQQGVTSDKDFANYNALALAIQKEITYYRWGWNASAFIGSGKAVGGGNANLITYQKDNVAFTIYGISPRIFYRLSGKINAGLTVMALMKNIDWPKDSDTQTIDSGPNLSVTAMADLNIKLFQNWDFYSGIGPVSEGATLWRIGLNYRF